MADKEVGGLSDGGVAASGDLVHAVRSGNSRKVTLGEAAGKSATELAADMPNPTTSAKGSVEKATDGEVYAATADKYLSADLIESASAEIVLTDGSSPAFDWDAGINRVWTLAANRTLPNPTNGQPGTHRQIRVIGNNATDRTLGFGTQYEGDLPTLTDIDNVKQYLLTIRCISTTHFIVTAQNATVS